MHTFQNICAYTKYSLPIKMYAHTLEHLRISKISASIQNICTGGALPALVAQCVPALVAQCEPALVAQCVTGTGGAVCHRH